MSEKKNVNFYDVFQIGLEIEGSFLTRSGVTREKFTHSGQDVASDGSINSVLQGGENYEIRSQVIENEGSETKFLTLLESISKDYEKEKIFAYQNKSCGTHIHFSLRGKSEHDQNALRVFDSVDFERFFFDKYLRSFKLKKFTERLRNNRYCRLFIKDLDPTVSRSADNSNYGLAEVETEKGERDRYYWLNTESLMQGKGMEIRIFPYLQTASGTKAVIDFTKQVLMEYWNKPSVRRRAELIDKYYAELAGRRIAVEKLNAYEKVLYKVLYIDRPELKHSADTIIFLMELFKTKPSVFESPVF